MFPEAEWREYYFQTQLFRVLPEYNIKCKNRANPKGLKTVGMAK